MSIVDTKTPNITTPKKDSNVIYVALNGRFCPRSKNASVVVLHIPSTPGSIPADAKYVANRSSTKKEEVISMGRLVDRLVAKVKAEVLEKATDSIIEQMTEHLVADVMRDFRDQEMRSRVSEKIAFQAMERLSLDKMADAAADHYVKHDFDENDITEKVCTQLSQQEWFTDEAEDAIIDCVRDGLDTQSMIDRIAKRVADMVDLNDVERDIVKTMVEDLKQELVD